MIFRREFDVVTKETVVVDQLAYKNKDGVIVVLDAIEPTPDGFEVFDPNAVVDDE